MSAPLNFISLSIRNFLSFGNNTTVVDLSNAGSTLITGENLDTNSANGAGKTTIINAICYALYNKPFDNISLQRLINASNEVKSTLMEVKITFQKGDDEFEIYRCRGESVNIKIFINGDDVTLDSVIENDKLVEEIVGISYDLFTKIVIFSGASMPFLQLPVAHQRNQFEELSNITALSEKAVKLKEVIRTTENDISVQEAIIKEQEAQLALYNNQVDAAKNRVDRWEKDRAANIKTIQDQLELLSQVDMTLEKELHALVAESQKDERELLSKQKILKKDKADLTSEIQKLTDELKHLTEDKCPYCLQQYEGAAEKLIEKGELIKTKQQRLAEVEINLVTLDEEITALVNNRYEADKLMKFGSLAEAIKAETTSVTAQQKITELGDAVNPHIEALEQLTLQATKTISYDNINSLKKNLEHQQFLLKLLTDKNSFIRRRIINKTIPFLNNRLINYTRELGLPHIVRFDDDMSCTVTECGRELDFGNLSSGEKKRVTLSLSLAFRDVFHQLHGRVNCLFIDEIDASLDGVGVEQVFKLLKNKARDDQLGLWIISHRPESIGRFDRSVTIRKQNGFSRIISDDFVEEE
jgi:DNA repair exonuclease SbcCD ATPase subunit